MDHFRLSRSRGQQTLCCYESHSQGVVVGEHHKSDLWTAYLMMLESDGKKERQLIEWANFRHYLYMVTVYRASVPRGHPCSWFFDTDPWCYGFSG